MDSRDQFLAKAFEAAQSAGHIFPDWAACEAAEESSWGSSDLATKGNNLFGLKQRSHPTYGTIVLPTKEYLSGKWTTIEAEFVSYPNWSSCFKDRMATLQRLAPYYPHYKAALAAADGLTYIVEVSRSWSTDPHRAEVIRMIHNAHAAIFNDFAAPDVDGQISI